MQINRITTTVASLLLLTWCATAEAQNWFQYSAPPRDFDWQLFSPEVDYDGEPQSAQGWFGNADRGHTWLVRPDRASIGNESATPVRVYTPANVNYFYAPVNNGGLVAGPVTLLTVPFTSLLQPAIDGGSFGFQQNTADDAYTETGKGWGNRVEFGWVNGRSGWLVSILDTHASNGSSYGVDNQRLVQLGGAQGTDGIDGINDPDGLGLIGPITPVNGIQAIPYQDGLYTVHVLFDDPQNLLFGYVDLNGDLLADDLNGDGIITPGIPGPGGFTDDAFQDADGDGLPDGDRVRLGVVFDDMFVENETDIRGIEVSAIRRKKPLGAGTFAEMYLGGRILEVDDKFGVLARGGILGNSTWRNDALNRLIGPQIGFRVTKSSSRWTTQVQARFMAAANFTTIRQNGVLGDHTARTGVPGTNLQPGLPTSLGGTEFFHRYSDAFFSPTGEFRLESAMQLTKHLSFKAGWTGTVAGNVTRAANTVRYQLPELGILHQNEALISSTATVGFEINR